MAIQLLSFSYKDGEAPKNADLVIDCRRLRNPYGSSNLRHLYGVHPDVKAYVFKDPELGSIFKEVDDLLDAQTQGKFDLVIAFGCYGGKHRSVAVVELVKDRLLEGDFKVEVEHTQVPKNVLQSMKL